jgi:hypothetical protein
MHLGQQMHVTGGPTMTDRELLQTNLIYFRNIPKKIGGPQFKDLLKEIPTRWQRWDLPEKLYLGLDIMPDKGCWIKGDWSSYRQLWIDKKNLRAHRLSYLIFNNPINPAMFICHHCDRPGCVNPSHLFLGTGSDNHRDSVKKGRAVSIRLDNPIPKELKERDQWMRLERFCK